ncbi:MAG: FprA family A-type flavoprotein [Lentimicrobiaceae bacterium]|nr:FprA family A-type flavoprotein [Lentimicrobiaceae bacterium]
MQNNKTLAVSNDVYWVGILDPDLRTFDIVMETRYGTTYNSYFINSDKKAVVETAKIKFWDSYLAKLSTLCNPSEIEYIIVNHTEPDHSGSIAKLLETAPDATVVGSGNAIRYLNDLLGFEFKNKVVKDGDILSLGNKTLRFIGAPNLHWPDTLYTYLEEDKILFPCDSFGAHYCHEAMFDDLVENWDDAFKYYFDVILKPYSKFMLKAIEKIRPLQINAICPGHGPVLRSQWKRYVDLSEKYALAAEQLPVKNRIFIPYVSAYGNTARLAEKIAEGIRAAGNFETDVCDIEAMPAGEIDQKIAMANAIIIGSPTINQNTLLQIYTLFALINPIRDKGKLAAAFGSYGWSGEGQKIIESNLANLKLTLMGENVFIKFTPHHEAEIQCIEFGKRFAEKMHSSK